MESPWVHSGLVAKDTLERGEPCVRDLAGVNEVLYPGQEVALLCSKVSVQMA